MDDTTTPHTSDGHTYDQDYDSYVAMIERNGYGTPMAREQWQASVNQAD